MPLEFQMYSLIILGYFPCRLEMFFYINNFYAVRI